MAEHPWETHLLQWRCHSLPCVRWGVWLFECFGITAWRFITNLTFRRPHFCILSHIRLPSSAYRYHLRYNIVTHFFLVLSIAWLYFIITVMTTLILWMTIISFSYHQIVQVRHPVSYHCRERKEHFDTQDRGRLTLVQGRRVIVSNSVCLKQLEFDKFRGKVQDDSE